MTDKKQTDQNMEALSKAFKAINKSDGLEPSAELDALILQQAADASDSKTSSEEPSTNITDLSFRRGSIRARQAKLKKKSVLPVWAMPIGLAATVLLSFGVVNRVLLSPEFSQIGSDSVSAPAYDDSVSMKTSSDNAEVFESKKNESVGQLIQADKKDLDLAISEQKMKNSSADPKASMNYIDNELARKQELELTAKVKRMRAVAPSAAIVVESENDLSGFSEGAIESTNQVAKERDALLAQERLNSERESQEKFEAQKSEAQDIAETNRSKLLNAGGVARMELEPLAPAKSPEPSAAMAPVINMDSISSEPQSNIDLESRSSTTEINSNEEVMLLDEAAAIDSQELGSDIEEVVIAGARTDANKDTFAKLTEVKFEDRQCKDSYDCALVALECDSCDCLEAMNRSNIDKYASDFSLDEIKQQCADTYAECVLDYCQTKVASEISSE